MDDPAARIMNKTRRDLERSERESAGLRQRLRMLEQERQAHRLRLSDVAWDENRRSTRDTVDDPMIRRTEYLDATRLVLYSSDTPDIQEFNGMVKCVKAEYDYLTATADDLINLIRALKANSPEGRGFRSVAFACYGPNRPNTWNISAQLGTGKAADLQNHRHPMRRVLTALAQATLPGGRVDILDCNLWSTRFGPSLIDNLEYDTGRNFAVSFNKSNWVMESDGVNIADAYFYDHTTDYPTSSYRYSRREY